jgi:hypothetical protein
MVFDSENNLLFADRLNVKIRKISPPPDPAIRTGNAVLTSFLGNADSSSNTYVEIYGATSRPPQDSGRVRISMGPMRRRRSTA